MQDFFEYLQTRRGRETDAVLLHEAQQAFREAIKSGQLVLQGPVRRIYELIGFCNFEELGIWLRKRRPTLRRIIRFARRHGQDEVAQILDAALDGQVHSLDLGAEISAQTQAALESAGLSQQRIDDEMHWGGTEVALSLVMEGLEAAVLNQLQRAGEARNDPQEPASRSFQLPLPKALSRRLAKRQRRALGTAGAFRTI